ncbi:MAG: hypothetical protein RR327_00870, partial [Clostridia bacterium]
TIKKDKFEEFCNRVEKYLQNNIKAEQFIPTVKYDIDESEVPPTVELIKELNILEPYGVGNSKPIFLRREGSMMMSSMKNFPQHLVGEGDFSELLAFSQSKYIEVFRNEMEKALFIDYSINSFRGSETVKGNIKDFFSIYNKEKINNDSLILSYFFNMTFNGATKITEKQYIELIENQDFGVLSIAETKHGLEKLKSLLDSKSYLFEANAVVVKSNINRILLSPKTSINFVKFNNIVFCEDAQAVELDGLNAETKIYTLDNNDYMDYINVKQNRELFVKVYLEMKKLNNIIVNSYENITQNLEKVGIDSMTAMVAYAVFKELKLFSIINNRIIFAKNKKVELTDSTLYTNLKI